jgi:hypothetical protein
MLHSLILLPEPWKNITAPVGCLLVGLTILKGNNFKLMTKNIQISYRLHTLRNIKHVSMLVTQISVVVGGSW